jgi:hypothetical protein
LKAHVADDDGEVSTSMLIDNGRGKERTDRDRIERRTTAAFDFTYMAAATEDGGKAYWTGSLRQ